MFRRKIHVLIIDDEPDMCEALSEFLTMKGYRVSIATDGKKALQIARDSKPEAVLLDIKMPGLDGVKVLGELKRINEKMPVFVITAYGDTKIAEKAFELGVSDYVSKPFEGERIVSLIEKALKER